jgi:1,4-dihydroxy-2-naphthoate octaprenyltransferase
MRPAFLSAYFLPVLVTGALAHSEIPIARSAPLLALYIMAIVLIHAGANVLNDCCDNVNGSDDVNTGRIHPFTGGSRFIQNAVLTGAHSFKLGGALLLAGSALGLWVFALSGPGLLVVGLIGVVLAITYTAPPCLVCRGLGDPVVAITLA